MSSNAIATGIPYSNPRGLVVDARGLQDARAKRANPETQWSSLADVERQHILRVYDSLNRNKTQTARVLEIDIKTLYNRLRRYGLHP